MLEEVGGGACRVEPSSGRGRHRDCAPPPRPTVGIDASRTNVSRYLAGTPVDDHYLWRSQ